jgi:hypothetical protein
VQQRVRCPRPVVFIVQKISAPATQTFERLEVGPGTYTRVTSIVLDPNNPNHLVCGILGLVSGPSSNTNPTGGIYYTDNALDPVPTFTRAVIIGNNDGNLPADTNVKLAIA